MPTLNSDNSVNIKVGTTANTEGLEKAQAGLKNLQEHSNNAAGSTAGLTAAFVKAQLAVAVIEGGLSKLSNTAKSFVNDTVELGRETMKMTREVGISSEAASGLLAVFKRFGVDSAGASKSLGILSKNILSLADPTKYAGSVFDDLGIKLQDAKGNLKTADQVFMDVADRFKAMPNGVQKTAEAMQLFGKSGKDLLPILNQGRDGIQELEAHAAKLGLVLTNDNIVAIKKNIVAQKDYNEAIEGVKIRIGNSLMPAITSLSTHMANFVSSDKFQAWSKNLTVEVTNMVSSFNKVKDQVVQFLAPSFERLWSTIKEKLLPTLQRLWKEVIEPLIPVIGSTLVVAVKAAVDIFNDLLKAAMPVINFLLDHKWIIEGTAGAFIALKASMMLGAAFDAIKIGMAGLQLVTFPSMIASLSAVTAAWMVAFPVAGILADIALVAKAIQTVIQTHKLLQEINQDIASNNKSNAAEIPGLKAAAADPHKSAAQRTSAKNTLHMLGVPGYAVGTNSAMGGAAVVNEQGPEIIDLPRGAQVHTAKESRRMLAGQPMGNTLNVVQNIFNNVDYNKGIAEIGWRLKVA